MGDPPEDKHLRLPVFQKGGPFPVVLNVCREVHKQPRHKDPIRRDRESIGVDRRIARIQGVGTARAVLVKKDVAFHGANCSGLCTGTRIEAARLAEYGQTGAGLSSAP
jgi:hypothetical protein